MLFVISKNYSQTWVRTQFIEYLLPAVHQDTASVGPISLFTTPNGTLLALLQIDQNHNDWLVSLDSFGNILWQKGAGHHGGIYNEDPYSLFPTKDNGCIYGVKHIGSYVADSIYRRNIFGNIVWLKTYYNAFGINHDIVESMAQTFYNTTLIQFYDSLVEVDSLGNFIRDRTPVSYNARFSTLPDSNFIRNESGVLTKEDFYGVQLWTYNTLCNNICQVVVSTTTPEVYVATGVEILKINSNNGALIWSKLDSSNAISITSDLGFNTIHGNDLCKYDSSGTLQWTKTILLPEYGLKCITESSNNTYVTGGCWKMFNPGYYTSYCPMLIKVDSLGNGVVDSTDYYYDGNANDNYTISFGNDAVFVAAALGNAGSTNDPSMVLDPMYGGYAGRSVFGTNWSGRFSNGLNYKYSDIDGNGTIDTTDISRLANSYIFFNPLARPHWYRTSNTLLPELHFAIANNNLTIGDTLKIDVILGSPSSQVDSIYGLSFDLRLLGYNHSVIPNNFYSTYNIHPTALGDTSINLYTFFQYNQNGFGYSSMVLCRKDHNNAYVAGDTITTLYFVMDSVPNVSDTITLDIDWNAITVDGSPVQLNVTSDSIFFSLINNISSPSSNNFKAFPNPTSDQLTLIFQNKQVKELAIFDIAGRLISSVDNPPDKYILNTKNFPNGLYYLNIIGYSVSRCYKFIVLH